MLVERMKVENTVPNQEARLSFQLCSILTRVILVKSFYIFGPPFSYLWKEPSKRDELSIQACSTSSEYLSHSITQASPSLKNTCQWWCKNCLSVIPHPAFTAEIYWDNVFPINSLSLSFHFCPIFGDSLESGSTEIASANLGNRHEETLGTLPAWLCGSGNRPAKAELELRAGG